MITFPRPQLGAILIHDSIKKFLVYPKYLLVAFLALSILLSPLQALQQTTLVTAGMSRWIQWNANASLDPINTGALPLAFIPNQGQSAADVLFSAHTLNGPVAFKSSGLVLSLPGGPVTIQFEGASPETAVLSGQALPGMVNYYLGNNPAGWFHSILSYGSIRYQQLYPGIEVAYEGSASQLKSTFTIAPGADPALIRWSYQGASAISVDPGSGNLVANLDSANNPAGARLTELAPVAWQESARGRIPVAVSYALYPGGSIGFETGAYDPSAPLIIDPTLAYSSYLGGTRPDSAYTITVDPSGNAYVAGSTESTDFLGQAGTTGTEDVWIVKLNPAGSAALYTTFLVGNNVERPDDLVVDGNGNLYISGYTGSSNFPVQNAAQPALAGGWDFFAAKLNASGQIVYSTYLGTELTESPAGMAVDSQGQAHIVGQIQGRAAIYKLDSAGGMLYGVLFGGTGFGETAATGIKVNNAGEVYLTGMSTHKDLDTTAGAHQTECDGVVDEFRSCRGDVFLAKLNNADTLQDLVILYSTYFGGRGEDRPEEIYLAPDGQVFLTGKTISVNFPTTNGAYAPSCPSGADPQNLDQCVNYEVFVAKFTASLSGLVYATYYGGDYKEEAWSVAADSTGAAYITGWTEGNDLPLVDEIQGHAGGICYTWANIPRFCIDPYVAKFSPSGALVFSTYLGGTSDEFSYDIAVEGDGDAYITGSTLSVNYPTTVGSVQDQIPNPGRHGFVTKISPGAATVTCYTLNRTMTGSGSLPAATPASSAGCAAGAYVAGEIIQLGAAPANGWRVTSWAGTSNDASTSTANQVTMPAANHTVTVNYVQIDTGNLNLFLYLPMVIRP